MHRYTAYKMPFLKAAKRENALVLTTPKRIQLLKGGPSQIGSNRCQILGRGAYGTVFKAVYREHPVALKIIRAGLCSTLQNESHVLNWKHRNIVRLIKMESTPEFGLLIMERPNGLCLQRVVDTLPLPLVHRVFITLDILKGLRYCHCHNVLHLDIKPSNVLVALGTKRSGRIRGRGRGLYRRNYICKLCDFGCSLKQDAESESERSNQCSAKGTLRYMSPEALRSAPLSSASDIYSLGITMWQLQARRLPFYTLACNESIAYQVVKHDLRPDNYALLEALKLGTDRLPLIDCLCAERRHGLKPNSVDFTGSYHIINSSQLDVAMLNEWSKTASVLVRRNLNFEATHGRVHKRHIRRKPSRLAQYFDNLSAVPTTCLEGVYSELYRCCWQGQPELRVNASQLQRRLELILAKCLSY